METDFRLWFLLIIILFLICREISNIGLYDFEWIVNIFIKGDIGFNENFYFISNLFDSPYAAINA